MLAQLFREEPEREGRAVDGHPGLAQEVGQRADVIFVAVGQEHRAKPVALGDRVREIGDDVVDARHLVGVGKHEAAIDGDQLVGELDQHHVEPDLAEPAKRNQPDGGLDHGMLGIHRNSFHRRQFIVASGPVSSEVSR